MPFSEDRYDLSGRVALVASGPSADLGYLAREMDPFTAGGRPGVPAEVGLRAERVESPAELQRPAGDGLVTGSDGERLYLIAGSLACSVPDPLAVEPPVFSYEPGFRVATAFAPFVRTALQLAALRAGTVAVHAASVELDGGAVLVAGWSESGKTETALALMEGGARFLSDKWTLVGADLRASAFPIGVGIRRWVLPYLPRLRTSLPAGARVQLGVAGAAAKAGALVREWAPRQGGAVAAGLGGGVLALADRVPLAPSRLRAAYGQSDDPARALPVRAVAVLRTVPSGEPRAEQAESARMARRLAASAAYERRPWFGLVERARFAAPDNPRHDGPDEVIAREEDLLAAALAQATTLEVATPFPTDPNRVSAAIERLL